MKTKITTTRNTLSLIIGLILMSGTLFAQTSSVWTSIPNFSKIGIRSENGKLTSSDAEVSALINKLDITTFTKAFPSSRNAGLKNVYEIGCNCDENDLLQQVAKLSTVFVRPEIAPKYELLNTPNDYSVAFATDYALDMINAQDAWGITTGDSSVVIGISDSNFDLNHEELIGKYTYVTPSNTNTNYYHGTAVAITAAGKTGNFLGKSSIGFNSSLQLRGMNYNELLEATYSGAKVVNVSWTSGCYDNAYAQMVIDEVYNNGTVIIVAAGNGSTCGGASNLVYPAAHNHVIAISSVGPLNNHERTIGDAATTHQHNSSVDLCAPGYDVALTVSAGWYLTGNGTSFAAPYVSGTVALMFAVNPCLTPDDVEMILKQTAFNLDSINPLYAGNLGAGRLDAFAAVQMASTYNVMTITSSSSLDCSNFNQAISLQVTGGYAPYSVAWNTNETGMNIANAQGNFQYTAIVTDSNGCVGHYTTSVAAISPLTFDAQINNVNCNGELSGSIEMAVAGGNAGYSYLWSTGETSEDLYNLGTGNYHVNISDSRGCNLFADFTITEPTVLTASVAHQNLTIATVGSIDLTVNGGTLPYSYSWNNGMTSADLTNVTPGFYEVGITDAHGCLVSTNVIVLDNQMTATENILATIVPATAFLNNQMSIIPSEGTMGINELAEQSVTVYPNPAVGVTHIEWSGLEVASLQLIDMTGQIVSTTAITSITSNYELNQERAGEYFVKMNLTNGSSVVKKVTFI
jgi:hypothetical protein